MAEVGTRKGAEHSNGLAKEGVGMGTVLGDSEVERVCPS